jgi:DNA repair ATPase RecN
MELLFPSESNDDTLTSRVEKMDALLQNIQQVLSDVRDSLDHTKAIEPRVEALEKSMARLQSITMDLRNPNTLTTGSNDRIGSLEAMVNKLCTMAAEQKAALDQLVESQSKSKQDLKKEIHRQDDEPAFHEIEELVRRR